MIFVAVLTPLSNAPTGFDTTLSITFPISGICRTFRLISPENKKENITNGIHFNYFFKIFLQVFTSIFYYNFERIDSVFKNKGLLIPGSWRGGGEEAKAKK